MKTPAQKFDSERERLIAELSKAEDHVAWAESDVDTFSCEDVERSRAYRDECNRRLTLMFLPPVGFTPDNTD
jgi:hypothetical protein